MSEQSVMHRWQALLTDQMNKEITPQDLTFDNLHRIDMQIIDGMLKLISLFVSPSAEEIQDNVKKYMIAHPEDYIPTMENIWLNMILRVNCWKKMEVDGSTKAVEDCESFIEEFATKVVEKEAFADKALAEKAFGKVEPDKKDAIDTYINIIFENYVNSSGKLFKYITNDEADKHRTSDNRCTIEFMSKIYKFEAAIYIVLCMMILSPNMINSDKKTTFVRNILTTYFKFGTKMQNESNGLCSVLAIRYIRGMLRCNLTEDEGYKKVFNDCKPEGLKDELHEEINDHVDLLYAYAVLMKYKLFPNLNVAVPLYFILRESLGLKEIPYLLPYLRNDANIAEYDAKKHQIEAEIDRLERIKQGCERMMRNFRSQGKTNEVEKFKKGYNAHQQKISELRNQLIECKFEPVKKAKEVFSARKYDEELLHLVAAHRKDINEKYIKEVEWRCQTALIFRRYTIRNRIEQVDARTEFLLYLSYFQSQLTVDDRANVACKASAYSFFVSLGFYLQPTAYNLEDMELITNDMVNVFNEEQHILKHLESHMLSLINNCNLACENIFIKRENEFLYNYFQRSTGNYGFSMDDMYKEINPASIMFLRNNLQIYLNKTQPYAFTFFLQLHHKTIERIKPDQTNISSIPTFCAIGGIIDICRDDQKLTYRKICNHAYVKELYRGSIKLYDPNLYFTSCSDMSFSDLALQQVDTKIDRYSFYTERIQFYGGGGKDKLLWSIILGLVVIVIVVVVVAWVTIILNMCTKMLHSNKCHHSFQSLPSEFASNLY
jgi:hypothetical protein